MKNHTLHNEELLKIKKIDEPSSTGTGKAPTIKDVAELAGVAHTTVSRALNHPEMISAQTRNRILDAIRELEYKPNLFARGMKTETSGLAALVIPALTGASYAALAQGVQDTLSKHGMQLIIASSNHDAEQELALCQNLNDHLVDGVIIANSVNDPAPTDCFPKVSNLVLVARYVDSRKFDGIYVDIDDGVRQLVDHLYGLGHRKFALITGPSHNLESRQRVYALRTALEERGLTLSDTRIRAAEGWTASAGWQAAEELLTMKEPPTALLTINDILAAGAASCAASLGIRIPEDLSLAGFYNESGSECMIPPLTTVDTGYYEIGCQAAELLLARQKDPTGAFASILRPVTMIPRDSTGPIRK